MPSSPLDAYMRAMEGLGFDTLTCPPTPEVVSWAATEHSFNAEIVKPVDINQGIAYIELYNISITLYYMLYVIYYILYRYSNVIH